MRGEYGTFVFQRQKRILKVCTITFPARTFPTLSVELGRTSSASRSFGQMDLFPDILTEAETTLGLVFKPEELVGLPLHNVSQSTAHP